MLLKKGRKNTYEERLEIVQYCIAQSNNYQEAAEIYGVSYQQVYSWMQKYNDGGEAGLLDRRGKAREEIKMTEVNRLETEVRKLQKANSKLDWVMQDSATLDVVVSRGSERGEKGEKHSTYSRVFP